MRSNSGSRNTSGILWSMCSLTDRKSTRLNSSHLVISYAVFCLKKKQLASKGSSVLCNEFDKFLPYRECDDAVPTPVVLGQLHPPLSDLGLNVQLLTVIAADYE